MKGLQWMPLYIGDWLRDIEHLTPAETGAYFRLILFYWSNGCLPKRPDGTSDELAIARITRLDSRSWKRSRHALRALFRDPACWRHSRVDTELAQAIEKSRVNSANASAKRERKLITTTTTTLRKNGGFRKDKIRTGFTALPGSVEFEAWKDWAKTHNVAMLRELQQREQEGRSFDFEAQWPQ